MKSKIKKQIEYEDAPSGNVTFYNYKEPLMRFEEGYGFIGALVFDTDTDKIQCHFCGGWYGSLPHHLKAEHNMNASAYKEAVGLNQTTALISESMREKLISSGLDKRLQNLRAGGRKSQETKDKIRKTLKKNTAEMKNLRNCCPEQLIERLKNKYIEIGHTPSEKTLGFSTTLVKTFGTYREACRLAGIPEPLKVSQTYRNILGKNKWNRKVCVEWVRNWVDTHSGLPTYSTAKEEKVIGIWVAIARYGKKEILREALGGDGKYRETDLNIRYTDEELLFFIRNFKNIYKREPSYSDCKRGLLPVLSRYSYHFGSWKKALALANKND